ncbi:Gldg family protein [Marinifilum sp.]|uniref:Gldg family protein n=1 Tax=Marinifilum sp. TaxID=2033137 RepID=UPI003BAADC5F
MKTTLKIAKLQLVNLMYSPVAWAVLVVFALYSGIQYTDAVENIHNMFKQTQDKMDYSTLNVFGGYLFKMKNLMFLFVPILTMGLISNEINSGTIKLLYSSPIKIRSIVIGKYLAILIFSLFIVLIMAAVVVGTGFFVNNMDYGLVLTGLLGFFLLISTYCAIGLFMSTWTRYQVISGIASIALLYLLDYVGKFGQDIYILGDILNWLSISKHSTPLLRGYIVSSDVLYFVIITVLFLAFAINKMTADRLNSIGKQKIRILSLAYVGATVLAIMLITVPQLKFYLDTTETKRNTVNPVTIEIMEKLDEEPLTIRAFANVLHGGRIYPKKRNGFKRSFSNYTRFMPDIKFQFQLFAGSVTYDRFQGEFKNYSIKKKAEMTASYYELGKNEIVDINELDIKDQEVLNRYDMTFKLLLKFQYKGNQAFVRTTRDDRRMGVSEFDYATAMKTLIVSPKHLVFLSGNNERSIERAWEQDWNRMAKGWTHRSALVNHGFTVENVNLKNQSIPEKTDVLIIADPMIAYTETELEQIKNYIEKGGHLLIAAEGANHKVVNPLLSYFKVEIQHDKILSNQSGKLTEFCSGIINQEAPEFLIDYGIESFDLPGASPLEYEAENGFNTIPLVKTDEKYTSLESTGQKGSFTTALALNRRVNNKDQKVIIIGDADFASDKEILKTKKKGFTDNSEFYKNLFRWFTDGEYPLRFEQAKPSDNTLNISNEKEKLYKIIYIWIIPFALLLIGGYIFWRRRRM